MRSMSPPRTPTKNNDDRFSNLTDYPSSSSTSERSRRKDSDRNEESEQDSTSTRRSFRERRFIPSGSTSTSSSSSSDRRKSTSSTSTSSILSDIEQQVGTSFVPLSFSSSASSSTSRASSSSSTTTDKHKQDTSSSDSLPDTHPNLDPQTSIDVLSKPLGPLARLQYSASSSSPIHSTLGSTSFRLSWSEEPKIPLLSVFIRYLSVDLPYTVKPTDYVGSLMDKVSSDFGRTISLFDSTNTEMSRYLTFKELGIKDGAKIVAR
jgi:hypothetical protein